MAQPPQAVGKTPEELFATWRSKDPFPEIRPALLNSADIIDYAQATGMIEPFRPARVKSASYPVELLGDVLYWQDGEKIEGTIERGKEFILKKNSIAFVTLEPTFRFPDYIAARFNLKIPNVYRGLLLGTGPLVDPGWVGRLSIPLHNLTTNDYVFRGGEELIWMEFTKISENTRWTDNTVVSPPRTGEYRAFPAEKTGGDVQTRVALSAPNMHVSSSLASVVTDAERAAKEAQAAKNESASMARRYTIGGAIVGIVGLATIVALAYQVWTVKQTPSPGSTTVVRVVHASPAASTLSNRIQSLEVELRRVERLNKLHR